MGEKPVQTAGEIPFIITPRSLFSDSARAVFKDSRLRVPLGEAAEADRGGDFCMAGKVCPGEPSAAEILNCRRFGTSLLTLRQISHLKMS